MHARSSFNLNTFLARSYSSKASALQSIRRFQTRTSVKMPKAEWNGVVIAESDKFETVENNVYFPPDSIKKDYFKPSSTHSTCGWKGEASYYTVSVDGKDNKDAAWFYPSPKPAAKNIEGYIAFWKGVKVSA
ncbi:uncharacterized protein EV422DRAFT_511300 [Fimicolochytrium jonesii]|uniref:uncharacterized protein n=1 Tax=Fimicolochytrium jonesii TaxID=1396493 RepID=UPI0022FE0ED8|nr:uncharacterized protein EV422DRAFT_511300 [Fimicolochytrium jonesii]KAI8826755.1 hypothetical protein EV422DRAFT_511300 [Fimicolochytrium jonesii]